MCNSAAHNSRPSRESVRKRIGVVASRAIDARDSSRCLYCARTAKQSGFALELDHLTPRSLDGEDAVSNLATACKRCNSARKAMALTEFAIYVATKVKLGEGPFAKCKRKERKALLALNPSAVLAHCASL